MAQDLLRPIFGDVLAWDAAPAQTLPLEHPSRGPIHGRGQPGTLSFVSARGSFTRRMTGIRKSSDSNGNRIERGAELENKAQGTQVGGF